MFQRQFFFKVGRQGTKETQIAVSKQKAHWEGNSPFPYTALVYGEIKSKLICSAAVPLCHSDVNPRCCFSRTMSLFSIMFSSHQISLLKEALFLELCLLQLSLRSSRYCNGGFCLKTVFLCPLRFHVYLPQTSPFLSLSDCSDCLTFN